MVLYVYIHRHRTSILGYYILNWTQVMLILAYLKSYSDSILHCTVVSVFPLRLNISQLDSGSPPLSLKQSIPNVFIFQDLRELVQLEPWHAFGGMVESIELHLLLWCAVHLSMQWHTTCRKNHTLASPAWHSMLVPLLGGGSSFINPESPVDKIVTSTDICIYHLFLFCSVGADCCHHLTWPHTPSLLFSYKPNLGKTFQHHRTTNLKSNENAWEHFQMKENIPNPTKWESAYNFSWLKGLQISAGITVSPAIKK